ncbi:hypothetical protein MMC17_001269 [Xylographa soralifera]|nr:hypothetical protein [Xylographa soralifera]
MAELPAVDTTPPAGLECRDKILAMNTTNGKEECMLFRTSARKFKAGDIDDKKLIYPFSACGVNNTIPGTVNPPIPASIDWCIQNCGSGYQLSGLSEWLHPLANWMAPYITLLVLCPVGEEDENEDEMDDTAEIEGHSQRRSLYTTWIRKIWRPSRHYSPIASDYMQNVRGICYLLREYFNILGDPASAIWGALSELESDTRLAMESVRTKGWFKKDMIRMVILARQTKFNENKRGTLTKGLIFKRLLASIESALIKETNPEIRKLTGLRNLLVDQNRQRKMSKLFPDRNETPHFIRKASVPDIDLKACLIELKIALKEVVTNHIPQTNEKTGMSGHGLLEMADSPNSTRRSLLRELEKILPDNDPGAGDFLPSHTSITKESDLVIRQLENGMKTILKARIALVNGVVLPTVLALAVTASVFFDAYNSLGDNEAAHSLAYGVLYSWLLIVVVVGNCYATCVNPGLVKDTIGDLIDISSTTLPFRKRFANAASWQAGLDGYLEAVTDTRTTQTFGQTWTDKNLAYFAPDKVFGPWFYIKFFAGQMIGWFCMAMATASAGAISYTTPTVGLGCRSFNHMIYGILAFVLAFLRVLDHWVSTHHTGWRKSLVNSLYTSLVYANALVLIVGTALNLAGVYRSCRCQVLFVPTNFQVDLGFMTQVDVDAAKSHWLPVGYVAFTFVWMVCMVAIALRAYIKAYIEDFVVEDVD